MSVRKYLSVTFVLAMIAGCGAGDRKRVYPVSGAVFVHGQPAIGARVFFSPAENPTNPRALRPFAVVDEDGSFRLTTYTTYDGAPTGEYVVIVTWSEQPAGASGNDAAFRGPDRLKGFTAIPAPRSCGPPSSPGQTPSSRFA